MPRYQIEMNGQKFEVEAPDDQALSLAISKMQQETAQQPAQAQEQPQGGVMSTIGSFARGAADMASFGLSDEIAAGLGTVGGMLPGGHGKGYGELLQEIRSDNAAIAEQHPYAHLAGQVAGGVGAASGLARGGLSLTTRLAPNAGLASRVAAGAAEGAAYGGAYGLGSGEGLSDRVMEGAKGAALGGAFGGAFPVVAQGVSSGAKAALNSRVARDVASRTGVKPEVMRMLGASMQADGTLGPTGAANMQRAGSEAMLADAGPNARAVLDTAIQRGGPGAVQAQQAISQRAARGARDLTGALDNTLGVPQGVQASRSAIRQGTAGARSSAYDAAYSAPIDYASQQGQTLERLVKTRVPARVISEANELMRLNGEESQQILAKIADDGSVAFERLPDVRQLDYITRALNQVAESGDGAGALGGQTPKGRAYQNLSREIRDTLKSVVPEYGQALETAADPIRRSQAVELGSKLLSPSMTRDAVEEAVRGMTGPERQALAQGIRSRIDDVMANVTRTVQDGDTTSREAIKALKDLSSRANREKLTAAIGKQEADRLFSEIDRVATSFDLRASVAENSKTYARQATDRRVKDMTAPGPVETIAQGEPINAAKRIAQLITGRTPEKVQAREDEIYSQLADILTRPRGDAQKVFSGMNDLTKREIANALIAQRINQGFSHSQPAVVYPTTGLLAGTGQR